MRTFLTRVLPKPRNLGIHHERLLTLLLIEAEKCIIQQNLGVKTNMAREYTNLPGLLDALEDEMDMEAAAIAKEARSQQNRGLKEMGRAREALKVKANTVDRLKTFADNMEGRNTSNGSPPIPNEDTSGAGSSGNLVGSKPSETAHLAEVKGS